MKGKIRIIAKFHRTDLVICSHSRERKPPSYSRRNTVKDTVKVLGHFCLRWLATPLCFSEEDLEISPELLVLILYCYF